MEEAAINRVSKTGYAEDKDGVGVRFQPENEGGYYRLTTVREQEGSPLEVGEIALDGFMWANMRLTVTSRHFDGQEDSWVFVDRFEAEQ